MLESKTYTFKFVLEGSGGEEGFFKAFEESYTNYKKNPKMPKNSNKIIFDLETYKDFRSNNSIIKSKEIVDDYHNTLKDEYTYYFFILDVEQGSHNRTKDIDCIKNKIIKNGCCDRMIVCDSKICFEAFIYIFNNTFNKSTPIDIENIYNKKICNKSIFKDMAFDSGHISRISTKIKEFNSYETYTYIDRFFDKLLELKLISNYDDLELNT